MDVTTILSLDLQAPLFDHLGNLEWSFPCRVELACSYILDVLEDSMYNLIPLLEGSHSDVFIVVSSHLLLVGCSVNVSYIRQIIDGIKAMIELLLVGVLVKPLVPC